MTVDLFQAASGSYNAEDENRFIACDLCDENIEVMPVQIVEADHADR